MNTIGSIKIGTMTIREFAAIMCLHGLLAGTNGGRNEDGLIEISSTAERALVFADEIIEKLDE